MNLSDDVFIFSALTCWELSLIFLALYLRVSPRPENRVYAVFTFFLGAMIWCKLALQHPTGRAECVFWYRMHYLILYLDVAILIHFLALVIRLPLPRPLTIRRAYLGLGSISLGVLSPFVVHLAPPGTPLSRIYDHTWGPLYPEYVSFVILVAVTACGAALWILRQRAHPAVASPGLTEGTFSPFDRDIVWLIWTGIGVAAAGTLELVQQVWLHGLVLPINPRALATALSSTVTAVALLREIRRTEDRWIRLKIERTQMDALAQSRLLATYDMQHQIKNRLAAVELPLRNALRGFRQDASPERQQSRLTAALEETQELFQTLDRMLNVARLEAGEPVHLGPKQVTNAVQMVEEICRRQSSWEAERRTGASSGAGPRWEFLCKPKLDPPHLFLHTEDLEHVLTVLLDNAVKYSPQGGTVIVRLWSEQQQLRLSVSDEGIGITPEELSRIGTRAFYRASVSDKTLGGTGLGLYLAQRLVEAQGGRLWAESVLHVGSTFHLALPQEAIQISE